MVGTYLPMGLRQVIQERLSKYYRDLCDDDVANHIDKELTRQTQLFGGLEFSKNLRAPYSSHLDRLIQYGSMKSRAVSAKYPIGFQLLEDCFTEEWYKEGLTRIQQYNLKHQEEVAAVGNFLNHIRELYGTRSMRFLCTDVPEIARFFVMGESDVRMSPHYVARHSQRKQLDVTLMARFFDVVAHHLL